MANHYCVAGPLCFSPTNNKQVTRLHKVPGKIKTYQMNIRLESESYQLNRKDLCSEGFREISINPKQIRLPVLTEL